VHDEILERKVVIFTIRYIKRIYLYLMSIQYIVDGHVHIVKMTTSWIGICL